MTEDAELLRRYADEKSQDAFAELVRRHLALVYSCALRRVGGDSQLAEDVTQQVFAEVARRAATLACRPVLTGWLFTSTRYAASKAMRAIRRRLEREQEAYVMQALYCSTNAHVDWEKTRPVLDDVIGDLGQRDRDAILLRFFEHRDFQSIGARLNLTDNAARMRVERALEKLRAKLAHRGITSTAAAIATVLTEQTAVALPAGLAANVTSAAMVAGTFAGGTAAAMAPAIAFMGVTKLQVGIVGALIVATGSGFLIQAQHLRHARAEVTQLQGYASELTSVESENKRLKAAVADVASIRQDESELARLRDEAAGLRTMLRTAQANAAASSRLRPAITEKTNQLLQAIKSLQDMKNYAGMIGLIDGIIPQLDPTSYDMAYVLDIKAKVYLQMDQFTKAIESWEKALQLSQEYGYFDAKRSGDITRYLAQLRYHAGLTKELPVDGWF